MRIVARYIPLLPCLCHHSTGDSFNTGACGKAVMLWRIRLGQCNRSCRCGNVEWPRWRLINTAGRKCFFLARAVHLEAPKLPPIAEVRPRDFAPLDIHSSSHSFTFLPAFVQALFILCTTTFRIFIFCLGPTRGEVPVRLAAHS